MPLNDHRRPVQTLYTKAKVRRVIQAKTNAGRSLRQIAKSYGKAITHADIQRILLGQFPVGFRKRQALRIPLTCPKCDQPLPKPARHVPPWLTEAAENLRRLEAAANPLPDKIRVYGRDGRRAKVARVQA